MKLETTLEERPGFLHVMPLFDLFMVMTMLLLLGPMFLSQSGVSVELPVSRFQMQRYSDSIVVTLGPGGGTDPKLYIGRQAVTLEELRSYFEQLGTDETISRAMVLLKTDVNSPVGMEREITEIVLASGFKLALIGKPMPVSESEIPAIDVSDD